MYSMYVNWIRMPNEASDRHNAALNCKETWYSTAQLFTEITRLCCWAVQVRPQGQKQRERTYVRTQAQAAIYLLAVFSQSRRQRHACVPVSSRWSDRVRSIHCKVRRVFTAPPVLSGCAGSLVSINRRRFSLNQLGWPLQCVWTQRYQETMIGRWLHCAKKSYMSSMTTI